jgi:hypothetical protein
MRRAKCLGRRSGFQRRPVTAPKVQSAWGTAKSFEAVAGTAERDAPGASAVTGAWSQARRFTRPCSSKATASSATRTRGVGSSAYAMLRPAGAANRRTDVVPFFTHDSDRRDGRCSARRISVGIRFLVRPSVQIRLPVRRRRRIPESACCP